MKVRGEIVPDADSIAIIADEQASHIALVLLSEDVPLCALEIETCEFYKVINAMIEAGAEIGVRKVRGLPN